MSNYLRQIKKRRKAMNDTIPFKPGIPIRPGQPQQIALLPGDVAMKSCLLCQVEYFDCVVKLGIFSGLNPKNPTGQDQLIQFQVYVCRSCGQEYGKEIKSVVQDGKAE